MAEFGRDSVKVLMRWDIKPEREQDYFEFVVREWVPSITRMGLEPTGAWYTAYSRDKQPQIMAECMGDDLPSVQRILTSKDWASLHLKLMEYVSNYEHKVVRVTGDFQF